VSCRRCQHAAQRAQCSKPDRQGDQRDGDEHGREQDDLRRRARALAREEQRQQDDRREVGDRRRGDHELAETVWTSPVS
jgi:hypothetical protein